MSRFRLDLLPSSSKASFRLATALALFAAAGPAALAQKREDILSIQRDVAQLQDQVTQMRTAQDQKFASLEGMLKQALDSFARLSTSLASLDRNINDRLSQQQSKVEAPVAVLGTKVDGMSDEVRTVRESVAELSSRMGALNNKLTDISSAIRTLNTPSAAPPPPGAGPGAPGAAGVAPAPPAGVSADSLWQNATRDLVSGKDELALTEFADYVKYFPQSENAPTAQYRMGDIYFRAKQYDQAVQVFDAVLERFPENPKTPDALYMKGASLVSLNRRTEAADQFKDFLARYPNHSLAPKARQHLAELGTSSAPNARKKRPAQ